MGPSPANSATAMPPAQALVKPPATSARASDAAAESGTLRGEDEHERASRLASFARTRRTLGREAHWAVRYGISVACTLIATICTLLLFPVLSRNPFALFYAAVMLSAWYGGLGPGLVATVFSVLAIDTFLLPSFISAVPGSQELVQVAIFGGVALLISSLNATRKRAIAERDGLIALEQSAREEAERARRRSALLADASHILGGSIDSPAAIGAVAERVVPAFADWCAVDVVAADPDRHTFHRIALAGPGGRAPCTVRFMREYDMPMNAGGVARVIRTGLPEVVTSVSPESLTDLAGREPSMSAFVEFAAASYLIVPLRASGRILGAISLISSDPKRKPYGSADLRLAEDLAHRLAVALDNSRLYRHAQDANRMKDEFLAVVSHELRTPLNAILGWSQLLHAGTLDEPSVAQGMSAIERNAKAQARIIDDVLDVSRIIQGKLRLEAQPTRLRPVIEEAIEVVRPAAAAKGIKLETNLDLTGRTYGADRVSGDAERLRQVAWNLLSNAIKFTPEGGRVEVSLSREDATPGDDGAANGAIVLHVSDSGRGIDARFLPHVFERFRQADSSSSRAHGGLGLGLAIVRHLVELHGGTVRAESDGAGKGSTFTVRLPAEQRGATSASRLDDAQLTVTASDRRRELPLAHPELVGLRILLVEDERDAREMFSSMLEMCGAEVQAVGSTREAVTAFRTRRPDVLLSDIGMAGEDGYALIRQVRALEGERPAETPTPAMAITAFAAAADRQRALREGFQMHVPKPIGSADFAAAVATLARDSRNPHGDASHVAAPASPPPTRFPQPPP